MSEKITLDPSIATVLDIDSVGYNERVAVNFTASENWSGDFEIVVYNSIAKNSFFKPVNAINVVGTVMTVTLEPIVQGLAVDAHYYEICSISTKRILFKGLLNITK